MYISPSNSYFLMTLNSLSFSILNNIPSLIIYFFSLSIPLIILLYSFSSILFELLFLSFLINYTTINDLFHIISVYNNYIPRLKRIPLTRYFRILLVNSFYIFSCAFVVFLYFEFQYFFIYFLPTFIVIPYFNSSVLLISFINVLVIFKHFHHIHIFFFIQCIIRCFMSFS